MKIALVAGEASGDLLGSLLLEGVKQRWPEAECYGIGGERMLAKGFTALWPSDKLAVHGYAEALMHYREISGIRKDLKKRLLQDRPDVFIGIDAPDFNLDLEANLKVAGIKTMHFVGPSIWAWRGGRIEKIKKSTNHMLCLFPFEEAIYQEAGIPVTYVGHPLASQIPISHSFGADKMQARLALGLDATRPVVAVLPGSRSAEIKYIAPLFLQAVKRLHDHAPELQFVMPTTPSRHATLRSMLHDAGLASLVKLQTDATQSMLQAADVSLITSGTATLECMLVNRPMVIAYALHPISWQIMRRMSYLPWVGLPNILAEASLVPELLQDGAKPDLLATEVLSWLGQSEAQQARLDHLHHRFGEIHQLLQRDTPRLCTEAIENVLQS